MIAGGKGTKVYLAETSVSVPATVPKLVKLFKRSRKLHSYFHKDGLERRKVV